MAHGHGGNRVGSGRKPKTEVEHGIAGDPGHRGRILAHPSAGNVPVVAPIDEFDAPDDLSLAERQVWLKLAPFAFKNRTLTKATALAFELLCKNVVRERELGESLLGRNGADHRGLIREVNTRLMQFMLAPCGKSLYEAAPEAPVNKLDRFMKKA